MVGVYSPTLSPWPAWTSYGLCLSGHPLIPATRWSCSQQPLLGVDCSSTYSSWDKGCRDQTMYRSAPSPNIRSLTLPTFSIPYILSYTDDGLRSSLTSVIKGGISEATMEYAFILSVSNSYSRDLADSS